ncbi:MAG: hypothetical protein BWX64_01663 [Acidobacteria bacterium ADurb.Bin051]|nr:MAG: hypothetical protein BWX64_01663 [Acidobacteria bacterium ADurb.Bin051]
MEAAEAEAEARGKRVTPPGCPFAQEEEGGQRRDQEEAGSHGPDEPQAGEVLDREAGPEQRPDREQRGEAAEVAEPPAEAGDPADVCRGRDLGQEGADEVLPEREGDVRDHEEQEAERERSGAHVPEPGGTGDAEGVGREEEELLAPGFVGGGAEDRGEEDDEQVAGGDAEAPEPVRTGTGGHELREVDAEGHGDDHRGVAGVGEIEQRPADDLPPPHRRRDRRVAHGLRILSVPAPVRRTGTEATGRSGAGSTGTAPEERRHRRWRAGISRGPAPR